MDLALFQELVTENTALIIIVLSTIFLYLAFFGDSQDQHKKKVYRRCKDELTDFINKKNCNPIFVRLAWHDSGTFDKNGGEFPNCGGANGSIRFNTELTHGANAGLQKAVGYLKPFYKKYGNTVSWADLIQMASAASIEHSGGPLIKMKYGRVSSKTKEECPAEGNLPNAEGFDDGSVGAANHLRNVFHRMGFNDQEIVALSGAHTLGRAFKDRSGVCPEKSGKGNSFTSGDCVCRFDGHPGVGMTGGRAWTTNWLTFDNSYFQRLTRENGNDELLWVQSDQSLVDDEKFSVWYERYAQDQDLFFRDYAAAHKKLSEQGSKFEPKCGFSI